MIPTLRLLSWRTARQRLDRYVSTFRRRGPSDSRLLEVGVSLDLLIKESSKRSSFGSAQGSPLYGIFDIPQQRFAKCRGVVLHVLEDLAHRVSVNDGIDLPSALRPESDVHHVRVAEQVVKIPQCFLVRTGLPGLCSQL